MKLGQGRESAKIFLEANPKMQDEIKEALRKLRANKDAVVVDNISEPSTDDTES